MQHTLCFETICVENRRLKNLEFHEARLNKTHRELYGFTDFWNLSEMIIIPDSIGNEIHKCRLSYAAEIDNIRWEPYTLRTIRKIQRVYHDSIDYSFKYEDRTELNTLFAQRNDCDEILIIKNGLVTDSIYCNVAFFDGEKWFTPDSPLLPGTQRAHLLTSGLIQEATIREVDIEKYEQVKLFNAMVSWENAPVLEVGLID
ncbi:aminotransferase class IV family protein [Dyadobacter bucti]|uniref:aminotransferase class IV family protein n=1 Tax=Dyadobacter bucti TaxID=2572203 RepID=UPI003F721B27